MLAGDGGGGDEVQHAPRHRWGSAVPGSAGHAPTVLNGKTRIQTGWVAVRRPREFQAFSPQGRGTESGVIRLGSVPKWYEPERRCPLIEWILLAVILWYIADSAIYLYRHYSKGGERAEAVSNQSPFELIPTKMPGYNWMQCRGCGGEIAMMRGEPRPRGCLRCGADSEG